MLALVRHKMIFMDLIPEEEKKIAEKVDRWAKEMEKKNQLAMEKALKLIFGKLIIVQLLKIILEYEQKEPLFVEDCAALLHTEEKELLELLEEIKDAELVRVVGELENLRLGLYGDIAMWAKGNSQSDDPHN